MVSKTSGEDLALHFESTFFETSAADDYESVEVVFVDTVREIARIHDRQMPLQPLFISEDKATTVVGAGFFGPVGRSHYRRTKSPKSSDVVFGGGSGKEAKRDAATAAAAAAAAGKDDSKIIGGQRRTVTTPFNKFFNKGFKIFN